MQNYFRKKVHSGWTEFLPGLSSLSLTGRVSQSVSQSLDHLYLTKKMDNQHEAESLSSNPKDNICEVSPPGDDFDVESSLPATSGQGEIEPPLLPSDPESVSSPDEDFDVESLPTPASSLPLDDPKENVGEVSPSKNIRDDTVDIVASPKVYDYSSGEEEEEEEGPEDEMNARQGAGRHLAEKEKEDGDGDGDEKALLQKLTDMPTKHLKLCLVFLVVLIIGLIIGLSADLGTVMLEPNEVESPSGAAAAGPTIRNPSTPNNVPITPAPTSTDRPSQAPSFSPTMYPTVSRETKLFELLKDAAPSTVTDKIWNDASSNQHLAFQWLLDDPKFWSYSNEKLIQRWAMAFLSFDWTATGGNLDLIQRNSIIGNDPLETWGEYTDECDWWMTYYLDNIPCSEKGVIKRITLSNVGLQGTIPSELTMLTKLSKLGLCERKY